MRRGSFLLAAAVFLTMLGAFGSGHAADCGSAGSPKNGSGSCETSGDQVQCGAGTDTGAGVLSASSSGAEFCNSGTSLPIQGRIGAQQDCECAYIDGEEDNPHSASLPLNGWARVDAGGVHCRERGKPGTQSYNSSPGSDLAGCIS
jgi:hypothetical protein